MTYLKRLLSEDAAQFGKINKLIAAHFNDREEQADKTKTRKIGCTVCN